MMYTPKFLSPKNKAIDAAAISNFTWKSQGEPQTHFQLKIYKNVDDTLVYDSTKITSVASGFSLPNNILSNNTQYKWTVQVFGATSDAISDYAFLVTNSTPTVSLTVPSELTTQTHKFIATYSQTQNISIKKYRFILYNALDDVIKDTDWIYGFSPEYTVDGLLNGKSYKIECQVTSQNEMTATSGKKTFSVVYALPDVPRAIKIIVDNKTGKNIVTWGNLKQVTPVVTGDSSYVDGKFEKGLLLDSNASIAYNETVNEDFTISWHTSPLLGNEGFLLKLDDEFEFGYENNYFYVINQNIKFMSERKNIYTWEDTKDQTWAETGANNGTWEKMNFPIKHLAGFLFIEVTFNNVFVRRNNEIIATIEMGVV